jgi:hypothetical protein
LKKKTTKKLKFKVQHYTGCFIIDKFKSFKWHIWNIMYKSLGFPIVPRASSNFLNWKNLKSLNFLGQNWSIFNNSCTIDLNIMLKLTWCIPYIFIEAFPITPRVPIRVVMVLEITQNKQIIFRNLHRCFKLFSLSLPWVGRESEELKIGAHILVSCLCYCQIMHINIILYS